MKELDKKKWYKRAAIAGAVLALSCHFLPPQYRVVCEFISSLLM